MTSQKKELTDNNGCTVELEKMVVEYFEIATLPDGRHYDISAVA